MRTHGLALFTLTAAVTWGARCPGQAVPADTLAPDVEALKRRISVLEAQVEALGEGRTPGVDEQRLEAIRVLVRDVLSDADERRSLLDTPVRAGWDNGFFVGSGDGHFLLRLSGQIQARWVGGFQDGSPTDDDRTGFELTRTRLGFRGHVLDPSWSWFLWTGWTATGRSLLLDAWISKSFDGGWTITAGQFKLPVWQEWLVSETRQQLVERSLIEARYSSLYGQGLKVTHVGERLRVNLVYSDGLRTWNTPWVVGPSLTSGPIPVQLSNEYAMTARAELRFGGSWARYGEFQSWPDETPMTVIGAALQYQQGEFGTADDEIEILQWTVDASVKLGGANLFAGVIGTSFDDTMDDRDELGLIVQGGAFVADDLEIVGRYEWGDLDGAGVVNDHLSVATVGLNRFWHRHRLKWTTDVGYAFEPVDAAWAGTGRGWRADAAGRDGQVVVRTQIQILF